MRVPWRATLGLALSVALLYWALRGVAFGDVIAALRSSSVPLWIAAIVTSQLIFPLRALRWRPILESVATDLPFRSLWRATAIGMMLNNLGGRIGEPARAYALAREEPRVPFASALASLVVDRTFDALVLLILLLIALLDPAFSAQATFSDATIGAVVAGGSAVVAGTVTVLYLAVFAPLRIEAAAAFIARRFAPRFEQRARALARDVSAGLGVLREPRRMAAVFLWTLLHWLVNAFAIWISFLALGVSVPPGAALLTLGLIALGAALVPSPGFIGVFEAAGKAALLQYGVGESEAVTWALSFHVLTLIPITLIGMWYLGKLGMSLDQIRHARAAKAEL